MPGKHARLSPSKASMWMACPGQPALAGQVSEGGSSKYASQGTAAHFVLERCVNPRYGFEPEHYLGTRISEADGYAITAEDVEAIREAVSFVRSEIRPGDEVECEVRLRWDDDLWGTADVVRYRPSTRELLICDYKHGSGVAVEATDNPQGIAYLLMKIKALGNRGVDTVRFAIMQPRMYHPAGRIREFRADALDMMDWEGRLLDAFDLIRRAQHDFDVEAGANDGWALNWLNAGTHCRWCPAKAICPAQAALAKEALDDAFTPWAGYDVNKLAEALGRVEQIEAYARSVREFAYAEAERGAQIPGWKLVDKRPTERWRDETRVVENLVLLGVAEDDLYERSLKSPARVRAALEPLMAGTTLKARTAAAKALLSDYTSAVSSGHSLVPADDDRAAARDDPRDIF